MERTVSSADDVISDIDHALNDWSVSADAMRWDPAPAPVLPPPPEYACVYCDSELVDDFDESLWRSTGGFGGTGSGAHHEPFACPDAPDQVHHIELVQTAQPATLDQAMAVLRDAGMAAWDRRPHLTTSGRVRVADLSTGQPIEGFLLGEVSLQFEASSALRGQDVAYGWLDEASGWTRSHGLDQALQGITIEVSIPDMSPEAFRILTGDTLGHVALPPSADRLTALHRAYRRRTRRRR